jgi:hypothetical protein
MLTLVFLFMLFNLTSIWNLPTISTGDHRHDGVPKPCWVLCPWSHSKSDPVRHPPMEVATRDFMPCCAGQFAKSHLPSQSDRSPLIIYGPKLGLHCVALPPW